MAGMNEFFECPVHFRCPSCGSREIARIQWGRPRFTKELEAALDAGVVVLGGCMVASDSPRWRCRSCGHEFGDLGIRIVEYSRVGIKAPDYVAAYHETMNNRDDLSRSDVCGCFAARVSTVRMRFWNGFPMALAPRRCVRAAAAIRCLEAPQDTL